MNVRIARDTLPFTLPFNLSWGALTLASGILGWVAVGWGMGPKDGIPPLADGPALTDTVRIDSKGQPAGRSTEISALREEGRALRAKLAKLGPRGNYVAVDRENNRIYLLRKDSVLVNAAASTGSGAILRETGGQQRSWTFDTPKGQLRFSPSGGILWTKPDWAFLEAGEPIPVRVSDRKDYGSLGEFALDLGDGYMIHGTLYERLLGRSVTHGCVRVGRDALRAIVNGTRVGTPVFIF